MDTLLTGKDFIARLDELLTERCMSDSDITKKVNLSSGCISKMRSTGSNPTFKTMQLICIALNVSLSEFFNMNKSPIKSEALSDYELNLVSLSREIPFEKKERLISYAEGLGGK